MWTRPRAGFNMAVADNLVEAFHGQAALYIPARQCGPPPPGSPIRRPGDWSARGSMHTGRGLLLLQLLVRGRTDVRLHSAARSPDGQRQLVGAAATSQPLDASSLRDRGIALESAMGDTWGATWRATWGAALGRPAMGNTGGHALVLVALPATLPSVPLMRSPLQDCCKNGVGPAVDPRARGQVSSDRLPIRSAPDPI